VNPTRRQRIRQLATVTCTALVLGAGLVLAAQGPGRADQSVDLPDRERYPLWVPGSDVPMVAYIRQDDLSSAPPR
jgi:hypothetical protein